MSMKVYLSMKIDDLKTRFRDRKDKRVRIDQDLPLNVRWGSRVEISEAPFLLREGSGFVPYPGSESLIGAFSRVDMAGLPTARYYMKDRDNPDSESMLLVARSPNSESTSDEIFLFREKEEIPMYYTRMDEAPNEDAVENAVDFWIGNAEGIIGMPYFHSPDEVTYERLWEPDNEERIAGAKFIEDIKMDPYGEQTLQVEHMGTMLYARTFEGIGGAQDEYMLPTVEHDDSGFRVRIWLGLPLSEADLGFPDAV